MSEHLKRLAAMWRREELEAGLDEEMQFHIEQQTKKNIAQGMDPSAARRAAEARFGGVDRMKEITRDEFRPALLEDTMRDLRYGVRTLLRAPGFAIIAILTLGLGIGAATAVFSVVNGVLLKPLPYPEPQKIVRLFQVGKTGNDGNVSNANFVDWKTQTHSFSHMAEMHNYGKTTILAGSTASRDVVAAVSREFFDVMRVKPVIGRGFGPDDQRENASPVVLVSDRFWRTVLGGSRINGQTVRFENQTYQVVGVMPPGFNYPSHSAVWRPAELTRPAESRTAHNYSVVARIADNATTESAAKDISDVSKRLQTQYGEDTWMFDAHVVPLREHLTGDAKPVLLVLLGGAAFLLLIACANVSSLLLARAASRQRELSVRLALGAGRVAVIRQLMAESFVLCIAGGALGIFVASLAMRTLLANDAGSLPRVDEIQLDWVALMFATGISVVTAILLGLATSARTGQRDLRSLISNDGRTLTGGVNTQLIRDTLVVAQVALTIVLLMATGLLTRSFARVLSIDPGFSTEDALVLDMSMASTDGDAALMQRQVQFQSALIDRLRAMPGVKNVGIVSDFPLGDAGYANGQFIEMNAPDEFKSYDDFRKLTPAQVKERAGSAGFRVASDDYFKAMGIRVITGRVFEPRDAPDAPHVAVITESLAKAKWPGQEPIGRIIQFGNMDGDMHGLRVIGIVSDVHESGPEAVPEPLVYVNYRQRPGHIANFTTIVRGPKPDVIRRDAEQIVHQLDPQLPVLVQTVQQELDATFAGRRFSLIVIGMFGGIALVLATLGLYGVIAYLVAQRTREIGIRTVLGAPKGKLMRLVMSKAARLAVIGTFFGIAGALGFAKLLKSLLFGGVTSTDPGALAGVILTIGIAVIAATAIPVRRALRISPMMALRDD